jgi:hypothetical protein
MTDCGRAAGAALTCGRSALWQAVGTSVGFLARHPQAGLIGPIDGDRRGGGRLVGHSYGSRVTGRTASLVRSRHSAAPSGTSKQEPVGRAWLWAPVANKSGGALGFEYIGIYARRQRKGAAVMINADDKTQTPTKR